MTRRRSATLRDVATSAGVSRTTASYILNGRADEMRIASATVAKVQAAVADLGYRPNRSARSLRTQRTATVGLISDQIAGEQYGSSMLTGASVAARELDHLVVMGESGGDPDLERLLIEEMLEREVDGVVYATRTARTDPAAPRPARRAGGPAQLRGAARAARLRRAGRRGRRPGGRRGPARRRRRRTSWWSGRTRPARRRPGRAGWPASAPSSPPAAIEVAGVVACDWSVPEGFEATRRWLAAGGRAAGLVCMNDRLAMGAYQALAEAGLRVPERRQRGVVRRVVARRLAAPGRSPPSSCRSPTSARSPYAACSTPRTAAAPCRCRWPSGTEDRCVRA